VDKNVNEVELLTNGNWKLVGKGREVGRIEESIDLSDEDVPSVGRSTIESVPNLPIQGYSMMDSINAERPKVERMNSSLEDPKIHDSNIAKPDQPQIEVITIEDDEPTAVNLPNTRKRPHSDFESNGIPIITLSDSDDSDD